MSAVSFDLPQPLSARRIVVAMSGGVDSSVVAALAARSGAETIGVPLQLYDHGEAVGRAGACCAGRDIRDAIWAAARVVAIPHATLDGIDRVTGFFARLAAPVPFIPLSPARIDILTNRTRYPADKIRSRLDFEFSRPMPAAVDEIVQRC